MRSVGLEVGKERVPKPHRLKVRSQPDLEGTKSLVSDDVAVYYDLLSGKDRG